MLNYLHIPDIFFIKMYDKQVCIKGKIGDLEGYCEKRCYGHKDIIGLLMFIESEIGGINKFENNN